MDANSLSKTEGVVKRLFFGAEIAGAWPESFPPGRILPENVRHLTLAFLGNMPFLRIHSLLDSIPLPRFQIGSVGKCDRILFLPLSHPRAIAYHVTWLEPSPWILSYRETLIQWLRSNHFSLQSDDFLSHITIARRPFSEDEWKDWNILCPVFIKAIRLYESLGNMQYDSLWEFSLPAPFEEVEHTADIAFLIRGSSMQEIHLHAQFALAFHFPPMLSYFSNRKIETLDAIIQSLNCMIAQADQDMGTPFKAVSWHGTIVQSAGQMLEWEMIVDV